MVNSRQKGKRGELEARDAVREHWSSPQCIRAAQANGAFSADLLHALPDTHVEVKRRKRIRFTVLDEILDGYLLDMSNFVEVNSQQVVSANITFLLADRDYIKVGDDRLPGQTRAGQTVWTKRATFVIPNSASSSGDRAQPATFREVDRDMSRLLTRDRRAYEDQKNGLLDKLITYLQRPRTPPERARIYTLIKEGDRTSRFQSGHGFTYPGWVQDDLHVGIIAMNKGLDAALARIQQTSSDSTRANAQFAYDDMKANAARAASQIDELTSTLYEYVDVEAADAK